MIAGRIIRSISGFYDIEVDAQQSDAAAQMGADPGQVVRVRAKGSFRKKGITPLVGDFVHCQDGLLTEILPRRNQLVRPFVANVDQAVLVTACVYPQPNLMLLERFIAMVRSQGVSPVLVFNKCDQLNDAASDIPAAAESYRRAGFPVFMTCAGNGEGVDELREILRGKVSAFAGPSGVGKSSLLNLLLPDESQETGGLSEKIQRGKNTTRVSELLRIPDLGAWIADTPGFTSLYFQPESEEELKALYPEFRPWENQCYFQDCSHTDETDCAVKEAVRSGRIETLRYSGYLQLHSEIKPIGENYD